MGTEYGPFRRAVDPTPRPDDSVWPAELQDKVFFRRQGQNTNQIGPLGFIPGDFAAFRRLVAEYDATQPGQATYRAKYGATPVLAILIQCYQYLIAKYDIDAFRIDTVQYVEPSMVENFCNAMRECALSFVVANTSTTASFQGFVLIDLDINRDLGAYNVAYSNLTAPGAGGNALSKPAWCWTVHSPRSRRALPASTSSSERRRRRPPPPREATAVPAPAPALEPQRRRFRTRAAPPVAVAETDAGRAPIPRR